MDQYPAAETKVKEGTKVNLQVSLGPDPSTVPAPEPEPEPDVPDAGDGAVTKTVSIPLPAVDGMLRLTVRMDGEVVFDGDVDAAMNSSWPITVSGEGEKVLAIFYDNALSRTLPVEF